MINKTRKAAFTGLALIGSVALLAGCASAPSTSSTQGKSNFLPCVVSDGGGFNDKSFNQLALQGVTEAASSIGSKYVKVESKSDSDYAPNLESLVSQNCNAIVAVGFNLADAAVASAQANTNINYLLIDDQPSTTLPNLQPILFNTAEAAFLAGYTAAATSQSHIVGTFGGMQIPTVTIFMDGFLQGVNYYNTQNNATTKVLGWDGQTGSFTGGFQANDTARQIAQGFIDQGADEILPVGGPIYQSAAAAITSSGKTIALFGVDADLTKTDPTVASLVLTSIMKEISVATQTSVEAAANGKFSNSPYIGNLSNKGVGLAPLTNFSSWIPSDLQSKLDDLSQQIISGKVKVTSYLNK